MLQFKLEPALQKTDAEMKADLEAAKNANSHPDGSKMNKYEAKLAEFDAQGCILAIRAYKGRPDG